MYRVLKTKGYNASVVVENTETKANVIIGRISVEILDILEKHTGKQIGKDGFTYTDGWEIEVDHETATALSKLAMKMKKPIRDQRKKETKKEENKKIDAIDVLLGLAQYN